MEIDLEEFNENMGMMVRCPTMVLVRKEREKVDMEEKRSGWSNISNEQCLLEYTFRVNLV
jgi:hypothetical protein